MTSRPGADVEHRLYAFVLGCFACRVTIAMVAVSLTNLELAEVSFLSEVDQPFEECLSASTSVCIVGTDVPELEPSTLDTAFDRLSGHDGKHQRRSSRNYH